MMKLDDKSNFHSSHQYFTRDEILRLINDLKGNSDLSEKDKADLQFLVNECYESEKLNNKYSAERNITNDINYIDSSKTFYSPDETNLKHIGPVVQENKRPIYGIFYKTPAN